MVTGLRRVSWEKVDVSFHTSMRSFAAHSIIQVPCRPSPTLALWKKKSLQVIPYFWSVIAGQVCVYERRSGCHTAHNRPLPALRIFVSWTGPRISLAMQPEAADCRGCPTSTYTHISSRLETKTAASPHGRPGGIKLDLDLLIYCLTVYNSAL